MKTFKLFLVAVGMIITNISVAQNVENSFTINVENPVFHYENGFYSASEQTDASFDNDRVCRFDESGVIFNAEATLLPGSIPNGTRIKSSAGNFFFTHDYFQSSWGAGAFYYIDPVTEIPSRIRSVKNATADFMSMTMNGQLLALTDCLSGSMFGDGLSGGTYGGTYGDTGSNLVSGSGGNVLFSMNTDGELNDMFHFQNPDVEPVSVRGINAGVLVEMLDTGGSEDSSYYLLLKEDQLDVILWETPHYANADLSFSESLMGDFIIKVYSSWLSHLEKYDSSFTLVDDGQYYAGYGFGGDFDVFATEDLVFAGNLVCGNGDRIDYRYANNVFSGLNSYSNKQIISVDPVTRTLLMVASYTGSNNVLYGTALVNVPAGKTGVVFMTIPLDDSGDSFTLDDSYSGVIDVFAYVEKTSTPNEVISSDQHIGYVVCDDVDVFVSNLGGEGATMPAGGFISPPTGFTLASGTTLLYDDLLDEYSATYVAYIPSVESRIFRVVITDDTLWMPAPTGTWVNSADTVVVNVTQDDAATGGCLGNNVSSYFVASGSLPTGIQINSLTGFWEGSYDDYGYFEAVIGGIDGNNDSINKSYQFNVAQNTIGLDENALDGIVLYPNPATDVVNISYGGNGVLSACIVSTSGQTVFSGSLYENQLSIDNFISGVYFITLFYESGNTKRMKFIKR